MDIFYYLCTNKNTYKMKKIIIIVAFLIASFATSNAQTYIKMNSLYTMALLPNVGVETFLHENITFNGDFQASLWESVNGRPYKGIQTTVEVRYYPKQAFRGFYAAPLIGYDSYLMSKPTDHTANDIQQGVGIGVGLTLGYSLPIAKRWSLDFYLGGVWHHGWYHGWHKDTGESYVGWNKSAEWLPYKVGVTFAYRLTSDKKMKQNNRVNPFKK